MPLFVFAFAMKNKADKIVKLNKDEENICVLIKQKTIFLLLFRFYW